MVNPNVARSLIISFVAVACSLFTAFGFAEDASTNVESKFAKSGDLKVHYKSLGEGTKAVVLVHGWSCNHTIWKHQINALNGKTRLILVDLPGNGKSDRPKIEYTMDLFAKGIDAVLVDAGVEQAVLVGHSMGTPVIRQYYRLFPRKTIGLVAVDGAVTRYMTDKAKIDAFIAPFEKENFKETAANFLDSMFPKTDKEESKEVKEARAFTRSIVQDASQHVAVSSLRNVFEDSSWKDDKIEVPFQIIFAESPRTPKDYKEKLLKIAPDLDYQPMTGVGHFLFLEKPEEFNAKLSAFLKARGVLKD